MQGNLLVSPDLGASLSSPASASTTRARASHSRRGDQRRVLRGDVHRPSRAAVAEVRRIVGWYLRQEYGRSEGPGRVPYFADRARVGPFAVDLDALQARD